MTLEGILSNGQKEDLERLVDRYGMQQILDALADIAGEKSEHIAHMWQDAHTALQWSKLASAITRVSHDKSMGL